MEEAEQVNQQKLLLKLTEALAELLAFVGIDDGFYQQKLLFEKDKNNLNVLSFEIDTVKGAAHVDNTAGNANNSKERRVQIITQE